MGVVGREGGIARDREVQWRGSGGFVVRRDLAAPRSAPGHGGESEPGPRSDESATANRIHGGSCPVIVEQVRLGCLPLRALQRQFMTDPAREVRPRRRRAPCSVPATRSGRTLRRTHGRTRGCGCHERRFDHHVSPSTSASTARSPTAWPSPGAPRRPASTRSTSSRAPVTRSCRSPRWPRRRSASGSARTWPTRSCAPRRPPPPRRSASTTCRAGASRSAWAPATRTSTSGCSASTRRGRWPRPGTT